LNPGGFARSAIRSLPARGPPCWTPRRPVAASRCLHCPLMKSPRFTRRLRSPLAPTAPAGW
jgi:hypothetical protein